MVIPWIGFEFNRLAKLVEPTSKAKFVEFVTAVQRDTMPGVHLPVLDWPYVEGLRIDEAMHPLTILAVGLYGEVLPNQNGAPLRLVVPWKYGFKSGKSLARIRFVEHQPKTAWEKANSHEYGFYSNVNPNVASFELRRVRPALQRALESECSGLPSAYRKILEMLERERTAAEIVTGMRGLFSERQVLAWLDELDTLCFIETAAANTGDPAAWPAFTPSVASLR